MLITYGEPQVCTPSIWWPHHNKGRTEEEMRDEGKATETMNKTWAETSKNHVMHHQATPFNWVKDIDLSNGFIPVADSQPINHIPHDLSVLWFRDLKPMGKLVLMPLLLIETSASHASQTPLIHIPHKNTCSYAC